MRHLLRATRDPLNNMLHGAHSLAHAGSRCIFWSAGLVFRRLLPAQLFLDDWYPPSPTMDVNLALKLVHWVDLLPNIVVTALQLQNFEHTKSPELCQSFCFAAKKLHM